MTEVHIEQMDEDDPDLEEVMDIFDRLSAAIDDEEIHLCMAAVSKLYLELLLQCYPDREDRLKVLDQVFEFWRALGHNA